MTAMTISRMAEAAGVEVSTIRNYERRGLVRPNARRSSGYREYTDESVRHVRFVRHAQALGFTLEEIAGLLRLRTAPNIDCGAVCARASANLADVNARLAELERIRDALAKLVAACSIARSVRVVCDGLWCFGAAQMIAAGHERVLTSGDKASTRLP